MRSCRAFLTTLKGPARIWFSRLMPNSINTFKEPSAQFASHFIGGHRYKIYGMPNEHQATGRQDAEILHNSL